MLGWIIIKYFALPYYKVSLVVYFRSHIHTHTYTHYILPYTTTTTTNMATGGPFRTHLDLGNVPLNAPQFGDMTTPVYNLFFSDDNVGFLQNVTDRIGLGRPDQKSLSYFMRQAFKSAPGYMCVTTLSPKAVRDHVDLLNRRVLQVIIPRMKHEASAFDQYLKDQAGLTLIDRPCMEGCKMKWNPVETDRLLY